MNEQKQIIDIPDGIVVECPMVNSLRSVQVCAACVHHHGLTAARFPGKPDATIEMQHQIACAYPIARRILRLE